MESKAKTVQQTSIEDQFYKIFPNDLNPHNKVFGGLVMSLADRTAGLVAQRHAGNPCVTVAVDSMHFLAPAGIGDVLIFRASVNHAWTTSMEIGVAVFAENYSTGEKKHILSAYFTFVAVDENDKPTAIPSIIPETEVEKRRYEEANIRRERRQKEMREHQARKK